MAVTLAGMRDLAADFWQVKWEKFLRREGMNA
jgi:hypothetical protein